MVKITKEAAAVVEHSLKIRKKSNHGLRFKKDGDYFQLVLDNISTGKTMTKHGVKIFVDRGISKHLDKTIIDYTFSRTAPGFVSNNPRLRIDLWFDGLTL